MKKTFLISTGGTGGHVIPATIFYDHLKENFEVFLTTDKRGVKFINSDKYKFEIVSSPRITTNFLKLPFAFIQLIISIIKSILFFKNKKIDILIGTGGYMSFPICLAAKILNKKIYLFEPNMVIGRANKFLLKFSNKIFCYSNKILNFPESQKNKIILTKSMLRKEIYSFRDSFKEKIENKIILVIIGGSQGAKIFDEELKNSILDLSKKYKIKIYHQVSSSDLDELKNFYKKNSIENKIFNYEENIFKYIQEANLAITRAGASTLSELAFLKVPFIAIPYQFATDNHQYHNVKYYKDNDCCWILNEKEMEHKALSSLLSNIIENKEDYLTKKNNLEKFSYQNSWNDINEKVVDFLNEN